MTEHPEDGLRLLVAEWVERADEDLTIARVIAAQVPDASRGAGFHLQQAAEKYLKALLTLCGQQAPFVHDLEELRGLVGQLDPEFADSVGPLSRLNPFAVTARYPAPMGAPSLDEIHTLIALVQEVRSRALERIEAFLSPSGEIAAEDTQADTTDHANDESRPDGEGVE